MPVTESNQLLVRISEETEWAQTPSSPAMQFLRVISESLVGEKETVRSEEITGSPRTSDHIKTAERVTGGFSCYYKFGPPYKLLLEAALRSDFIPFSVLSNTTISAVASDNSINGTGLFGSVIVGQLLKISGFLTPGNNGLARVVSVPTADKVILANAGAGGITLVDEAAGPSVSVVGDVLRDGAEKKSLLIEKAFPDSSDTTHLSYRGVRISNMTISIEALGLMTMEFEVMGEGEYAGTATVAGSTTAASTAPILEAGSNVSSLREGGGAFASLVQSFSVDVALNPEAVHALSSHKPSEIALGDLEVGGNTVIFFDNQALKSKFLSHTETSWEIRFPDSDGNTTIITIPAAYYLEDEVAAGGKNERIMQSLAFSAKEDATRTHQIQIDLLPA